MWCGCKPWKEHVCMVEGMTSMPIDASRLWTPRWMQWLTELGHSGQGQTKGGVKWVSAPMTGGMVTLPVYPPDVEYSHPPEEGPLLPVEGWLYTLHWSWQKPKISQEIRIDSQTLRTCSSRKGGKLDNPKVNSPWNTTPTKLRTAIDSIVLNKGLW